MKVRLTHLVEGDVFEAGDGHVYSFDGFDPESQSYMIVTRLCVGCLIFKRKTLRLADSFNTFVDLVWRYPKNDL